MVEVFRNDEPQTFCALLTEHFQKQFENLAERSRQKVTISTSAYILETVTLTLDWAADDDAIVVKCSYLRLMLWIVAAYRFYGAAYGRFDTVLLLKNDFTKAQSSNTDSVCCWFAKTVQLVQRQTPLQLRNSATFKKKANCKSSFNNLYCKLCYIQWFKTFSNEDLTIDNIDEVLNWIRPRWQRTLREKTVLSRSKGVGILLLESLNFVVRMVRKYPFLDVIYVEHYQKIASRKRGKIIMVGSLNILMPVDFRRQKTMNCFSKVI